jgi:predicted SAM-dependent methyltransferase
MDRENYLQYLYDTYGFEKDWYFSAAGLPSRLLKNLDYYGIQYPRIVYDGELTESFNVDVFKKTHELVKHENKKFIYIMEDIEGYWQPFKHHEKIHEYCEQAGISEEKIIYFNNDISISERYDKWFEEQSKYKTKINVICFPFLIYGNTKQYKRIRYPYEIVRYKDRQQLPTKHFMCLMGRQNWFRDLLWNYFEENKSMINTGYISYIKEKVILPDSWIDNRNEHGIGVRLPSYASEQRIIDCESGPELDNLGSYHEDSYFSVIPETSDGIYASEKTVKALYHGHPFTIFCPAVDTSVKRIGILSKLRDWGFETFPELFDESYDYLRAMKPHGASKTHHDYYESLIGADVRLRYETFIKDFEKLYTMDIKELHKICESVEEKCIHNRKVLMNLKNPIDEVLNQIKVLL